METILNGILNVILAPIRFVISIINWTNNLLTIIIGAVTNLVGLSATLPTWVTEYVSIAIIVIVLYTILGRNTGK